MKRIQNFRLHASRYAFTLVEMIASMAILTVLLVMMISVLNQASNAWRQSEQKTNAFREARAALLVIGRDLRSMAQAEGVPTLQWNPSSDVVQLAEPLAPEANSDRLFFVVSTPIGAQESDDSGDLCMVGYYVAYTVDGNSPGSSSSYKLYRYYMTSSEAVPKLVDLTKNPNTDFWAEGTYSTDEVLAKNIINFRVTLFTKQADGTLEPHDSSLPWPNDQRPAMVELTFDVLSEEGVGALQRQTDWHADSPLSDVRKRLTHTFTTRIGTGANL